MKNKYNNKYGTYTQKQRLDMMRNGNTDVYNTEKNNNAYLRQLRRDLGLSTDDIDEWEGEMAMAYIGSNDAAPKSNLIKADSSSQKANFPTFASERVSRISNEYNNYMQFLKKQNELKQKKAVEQAENDIDYLLEYLANNGYSSKGKTVREGEKKIRLELMELLEELENSYKNSAAQAREKYIGMLEKSRTSKKS